MDNPEFARHGGVTSGTRLDVDGDNAAMAQTDPGRFWRRVKGLTGALLAAWLVVNVGVMWFARDLHGLQLFGVPVGFLLASQAMLWFYLGIIVMHVLAMQRLEAPWHAPESTASQEADASSAPPGPKAPR